MAKGKSIIENDVILNVKQLKIGEGSVIKGGTRISAKELIVGNDTVIDNNCHISGFKKENSLKICIGDDCNIGKDVNIAVPALEMGDYVVVHRNTAIFGNEPCIIGHNTWVGQNSILNSSGGLYIGNNVGIGTYSYIWSHVAHGELIEGTNLFSFKPVVIEDDAWLVGGNLVVSSGVTVAKKTCILTGSVLTKDTIESHCYAGIPAKDITDKVAPYREVTLEEKLQMMKKFVEEYLELKKSQGYDFTKMNDNNYDVNNFCRFHFFEEFKGLDSEEMGNEAILVICEKDKSYKPKSQHNNITVFNLDKKEYTKRRTDAERDFMKFIKGYRARFVPKDNPRIGDRSGFG